MADLNEKSRGSDEKRSVGELTVKVNVDVSEALTGLKALQREARKAVQLLRELENEAEVEEIEVGPGDVVIYYNDENGKPYACRTCGVEKIVLVRR